MPTPSQAAKKYQKELETQLWKLALAKDFPPSQGRRGRDRREAGDRPQCLRQALLLSKTQWGRRAPIPLMPQINKNRLPTAEKLLKTSTGEEAPGRSLLFQHLHRLCKGHRYSGNAELNFSPGPLLQWFKRRFHPAFLNWPFPHTRMLVCLCTLAGKLLKQLLVHGFSCVLHHLWVVPVRKASIHSFSPRVQPRPHSQHGGREGARSQAAKASPRLLCPWGGHWQVWDWSERRT